MPEVKYVHLIPNKPHSEPLGPNRSKVAIVVESKTVSQAWRDQIGKWLVENGCLYALAWGHECSKWDDSIDWANLEQFDYGEVPDKRLVITTWHNDESLEEFLWFTKFSAEHPFAELSDTIIIHVANTQARQKFLKLWNQVDNLIE